jgi:hypothetical protein
MKELQPKNIKRGKYINISTRKALPPENQPNARKEWRKVNRAGYVCDYNERTNELTLSLMSNLTGELSFINMDNVYVVMA